VVAASAIHFYNGAGQLGSVGLRRVLSRLSGFGQRAGHMSRLIGPGDEQPAAS